MSASLRSLIIFVLFPCNLTGTAFHIDVAEASLPHLPPAQPKLSKLSASWALANFTDTILQVSISCYTVLIHLRYVLENPLIVSLSVENRKVVNVNIAIDMGSLGMVISD